MIVAPEIDLTPESAASLARFSQLFRSGRFMVLATMTSLGSTDLSTLYRAMDRLVSTAAGHDLCQPIEPMTPQERLEAAQASLTYLCTLAQDWYDGLSPEEQQALLELLRSIVAWLQWRHAAVSSLPAEAQAVLDALKALLGTMLVRQSARVLVK